MKILLFVTPVTDAAPLMGYNYILKLILRGAENESIKSENRHRL